MLVLPVSLKGKTDNFIPGVGKLWLLDQICPAAYFSKKMLLARYHTHSLHIVSGCFHATTAELNSFHKHSLTHKVKIFPFVSFTEKICTCCFKRLKDTKFAIEVKITLKKKCVKSATENHKRRIM